MARMMGRLAWSRKCACFDCRESPDRRGAVRNREKHVTRQWLDEYESQDLDMCGVLPCCCIPGVDCERQKSDVVHDRRG